MINIQKPLQQNHSNNNLKNIKRLRILLQLRNQKMLNKKTVFTSIV